MRILVLGSLLLAIASFTSCNCGDDLPRDAGTAFDAGASDGGHPPPDAGASPADAGPTSDAGLVDAGTTVDAGDTVDAGLPPLSVCPAPVDAGPGACAAGTADCDSNPSDCETTVSSDAMNCGRCNRVCGATATCNAGLCGATVLLDPNVSSNYCHALFTSDRLFAVTCWGNNDLSELRTAPLEPGPDVKGTSLVTNVRAPRRGTAGHRHRPQHARGPHQRWPVALLQASRRDVPGRGLRWHAPAALASGRRA